MLQIDLPRCIQLCDLWNEEVRQREDSENACYEYVSANTVGSKRFQSLERKGLGRSVIDRAVLKSAIRDMKVSPNEGSRGLLLRR